MRIPNSLPKSTKETGFGYVEALISTMMLVIGLVGLLGFLTYSIAVGSISRDDLIAKQKAREALESIQTARNTQQVTFEGIQNVSSGGIFLDGFQPICRPDADGFVGTAGSTEPEVLVSPGTDEVLGSGDDETYDLTRFERQIDITPQGADLRRVEVTVRFRTTQGWQRDYQVTTLISRYR